MIFRKSAKFFLCQYCTYYVTVRCCCTIASLQSICLALLKDLQTEGPVSKCDTHSAKETEQVNRHARSGRANKGWQEAQCDS